MSEQQHNCVSDGEEDPDESQIDHPIHNDADIRKNLFDEFDAPTKKTSSDSSGREYMKAYLRVRPFSSEELEANENQQCVEKESCTTVLMNAPKESFAFKNSTRAGGEISHRFSFTNVFDEETTQKSFFDETTLPLVTDFIHGQNCLVFTYGVTNSGKTYTIQGTPKDGGVLPRSLDVLFNSIEGKHYNRMNLKPRFCTDVTRLTDDEEHRENEYKNALLSSLDKETFDINALLKLDQDSTAELSKASCTDESALHNTINCKSQDGEHEDHPSMDIDENISRVADDTTINVDAQGPVKFSVWVSFAEIYNETIYDLLEPCPTGKGKKRTTLRLGDDTNGNPYIKGLRDIYVSNADEAYKILKIGQKNQRIASTKLNQCSSRSHCIFSVKVLRVVDVEDPHVARVSRLSFVDLAGSERYSKTQSKGDRLKEAGNINTSLMTLGKCLEYLRYNQRNPSQPLIIPFRESKLTRLFQAFFCGKGRASMIVNVNMCASMFDETFHVMKFSAIAKKVTTRVSKPVDLPPPSKKPRAAAPTPRSKPTRMSVPWANGALSTPAPVDDAPLVEEDDENEEGEVVTVEPGAYQQQLMDLVKALQEKLIEEKRKMQTLEVKIREEVCQEMAEQLVSIEKAYSERVKMEVTAVEEKCDRRIELLTQSVKKTRKKARIERVVEDDEEWVPSVFLHAEQTKVREKQHLVSELNAKIAELRQEVKQLKESRTEETAKSEAVLELQAHLNGANEEVTELKQMLEEAGEAFTEKEAEISKLKAALDDEEACIKKQDAALKHLTAELEKAKKTPKVMIDHDELSRTKGALEVTMAKLADTEKQLETKDSMMKDLVRTLEETREELARERSFVAQAFDNDEEMIRIKDELQKAEAQTKQLEKNLAAKDEAISSLKKVIEDTEARSLERNSQAEETEKAVAERAAEEAALAKQLDEAKEEIQDTQAELEKISVECKGKDSQLQLLTKEFNEKVSELEDATRKISDKVAALEDMKRQVLEKETELNNVKEENSKTTAELENSKKALEEKIEALARTQCEVEQTQASEALVKGNAEKNTNQAARIKDVEAEIREKAIELENAKSESARKISELEAELCKKDMKKLQSGDALAELEQQLEESTKALDKKNSQVIARNNTIKRLEMSLAEKERLLSEMEKLPKEPNLRAKEELKTLRRRLVQADKEKEESRELLAKKDEKLEEAKQELEKLKKDGDEKSAKFLRELQESRTELDEVKEDTKKKQEQIKSLKEKLDSQCLKNACLQTQLENEKRGLLEKEKAVQEAKNELSRGLLEKEKAVQEAKAELSVAKSSSATELDEARNRLASTEEKVQELEDEVFTANETTSRIQDEVKRYEKEIVPGLENKVKTLEEELLHSGDRAKEAEEKLEKESNEARSRLEKKNEEIEQKVKEINELREAIKTSDQERFQESDKLWQEMMSMQKTIEERNKTIDEQEQKLREANLKQGKSKEQNQTITDQLKSEQEKSKEQIRTLTEQLKALRKEKSSLEERLRLVTSDAGKDKEVIANLQKALEEQDRTLEEQGQALDERQNEMETLTTELQAWQEKCDRTTRELEKKKEEIISLKKQALVASDENKRLETQMKDLSCKQESTELNVSVRLEKMQEEIRQLKQDCLSLEAQLEKKDEEIRKAHDSRENTMKTTREAFEVAKAKKAEYEVKLATVREQCRQELKREMDEELRRTKRDYQRLLDDKEKSLEEVQSEKESVEKALAAERAETSKTDSSASDLDTKDSTNEKPSISRSNQKKTLKRNSSELTLAELKNQLSASKARKTGDSDEEFTPGSVRKTRSRASTKKAGRSSSCRTKRTTPAAKVDILPTMEETKPSKAGGVAEKKKLFKDLQENISSAGEENDKDSAQSMEETENIPPKASQSTTKKRRKLFQKPSAVAALSSPATVTGSRDVKTEQDSTRNIVARQLRPRAIKYN